ncbi:unnamed protein product, partial [Cladocopium goreaui]
VCVPTGTDSQPTPYTRRVARPDLTALRGTSLAAQEARATLITKVQEECQAWFENTSLPIPSSFGFRRGLGTDDALFMIRRLDEEIGLVCGIPWRWQDRMNLESSWTRKNDDRQCHRALVETTIFADDTTLHGDRQELHVSDALGPSGMDCFASAVAQWGSEEHAGKRELHTYGTETDTCLVGIPPLAAAMEQEQMRWLGHIARMQSDQPRTYSKMFARGTLDAGEFQRVAAAAGGRISADRRSLPEAFEHGHVPRDGGNRLLKPKRAKLNSSASAVPSQSLLYHRRDKELPRQLTPTCRDLSGDTPSKELITPDKISAESRQPKETNGTCGWTPPPGTKTAQYTEAAQHWRKCRGEKAPQAPKEQKLAVLAQAGQTAAQIAKDSAEASWTTWTKEISEKHPQLASSRKSSETRSRKDPAWRRRAADKAAAKRRENGALEGIPSYLAVLYKVRSPLASERPETHRMRPNGQKDRYPLLDPVIHSLLTDLRKVCFTVGSRDLLSAALPFTRTRQDAKALFRAVTRAKAGNHVGDFDQTTTLEATDPDDVDPRIRHALRIRARKLVLREIQRDRFDFE